MIKAYVLVVSGEGGFKVAGTPLAKQNCQACAVLCCAVPLPSSPSPLAQTANAPKAPDSAGTEAVKRTMCLVHMAAMLILPGKLHVD